MNVVSPHINVDFTHEDEYVFSYEWFCVCVFFYTLASDNCVALVVCRAFLFHSFIPLSLVSLWTVIKFCWVVDIY